jgi:hypothetical protein
MSDDDRQARDERHTMLRALLDDFVDGTLSPTKQATVAAHVRGCASCRSEVASVRALLEAAQGLPQSIEPQEDLWPDLEKRIRQRPVVVASGRPSRAVVHSMRESSPRWVYGGIAAAATILALAAVVWWATRDARFPADTNGAAHSPRAETSEYPDTPLMLPAVVRGLEIECMGAGRLLQASLTYDDARGGSIAESVRDGVELVDRSIAETRAALDTHPYDARLVRRLTLRYQQKLDLLLGAMRLAEGV